MWRYRVTGAFWRAALLSAWLSGCGGGEDDTGGTPNSWPPDACEFISGGNSQVTTRPDPGCTDCSVADAANAADGDMTTLATVTAGYHPGQNTLLSSSPPQGIAVRATTQPGTIFPAGRYVGAWMKVPPGSWLFRPKTYLNGSLQESGTGTSLAPSQDTEYMTGFTTSKPFDAVEMFIANVKSGTAATMNVREICANIHAQY